MKRTIRWAVFFALMAFQETDTIFALPIAPVETNTIDLAGVTSSNGWTYYGGPMMVNAIVPDARGDAAWLATTVGLVRYDLKSQQARRWTTLDGLIDNFIRDLAADREGRIYAATFSGLSRFEPRSGRFTNWGYDQIGHSDLAATAIDKEGRPWVGCTGRYTRGAMCLLSNGVWAAYCDGVMHMEMPECVSDIAVDSQGGVWLIGSTGGIKPVCGYYIPTGPYASYIDRYGNATAVPLPRKDGKELEIRTIAFAADNTPIALAGSGVLYRMEVKQWLTDGDRRIPDFLQAEWRDWSAEKKIPPVMALNNDSGGVLRAVTSEGIGVITDKGFEARIPLPVPNGIQCFARVGDGAETLCAGAAAGIYRWRNGKWSLVVNRLDGPICGRGYPIHGGGIGRGLDGKLCLSRGSSVAFDGKNWTVQTEPRSIVADRLRRSVAESWQDPATGKWMIRRAEWDKSKTHDEYFGVPRFSAGLADSRGRFWEVNYNECKLLEFTGRKIVDHSEDCPYLFRRYHSYFDSRIYSVMEDAKGQIWVFTMWGGLLRHDGDKNWSLMGSKFNGIMGGHPWKLCCNGETIVCAGPWGTSEYHIPSGTWRNYTRKGSVTSEATAEFPGSMVEYAAPDREGRIWYGFYEAGVSVREKDGLLVRYTTADGLANNSVWGIYGDQDGAMWFTGFSGANRFDPAAFKRQARTKP